MEISDEVWEIAQDLYNDADIDINQNGQVEDASFMDFDEYNNYYRDCNEADFNKAVEYLNSLLNDEVKFYTDGTRYLELSDNHTLWSINIPEGAEFNDEDYSFMYNTALEHLQDEIGVEVFGLGRSGRHICVEDNFRNLTQLDKLKEAQDKWEDWLIETVENSFKDGTVEEAKELAPDEKVAKCLSCGMKVKYRNRDVKHDAMGDYIECPNCKSTFDVDYDNTPTKKTEAEDYSAFTPTNKVLSGNKGLSEKAINEMRWSLPDLFKDMTDEQKQIWEELSLRGMVMSCLIYGDDIHTSTDINAVSKYYKQPYVNEYYDTLGKDVTEEIIKQQTDYFNRGKVIKDVGTDSEGVSYNSFEEPKDESRKVTEAKYGDSNPDKIVPDAYCEIEKTDKGYYINCGIGDHTNLGSGNFTIYPEDYLSNLHKEVKKLAKERGIKRVYDKVKTIIPEYNAMIPEYNDNIENMIKDLTPFAEKSKQGQLTRADLDSIEEITGKITPNRMSTLPEFEWRGKFGRLRSLIGNLERYKTDLSNPLASADTITITESKEVKTEAEDMTQVKDAIETAVEKSDSTDLEKDQVKGSIDVLKTDEESAIEGYEDFKSETEKVADKELADAVNNQMEEIIDDEKEHIEKLDTIKSALGENKEVKTETVKIMAYGKLYYEYSNDEWNSKSEDEKDATIIDVADQATEEEGHTVETDEVEVITEVKNLSEDITSKDVDEIFSKYAEIPVTVKNLKAKWASASDEMHGVYAGGWTAVVMGNNFQISISNSLKLNGYKISGENKDEAEGVAKNIYYHSADIGYDTGLYERRIKTEKMDKDVDKKYSNLYKYKGKAFSYNKDDAIVEYVWVDPDTDEWVVIDEIGLSNDNWEDRKLRDAYLDEYIRQLDDEANRLADDFIANEFLGESLNQKINRKLQESREKFDRDELVAVKDSIDTALDDLQIQSDGTTGAMADKVLVNDLRSVSQSVGNYLNKVQEGKDLKHPELNNSVKAYYADSFGKDELNSEIKEVTFLDLYRALKNKQDVYDLIGVRDSVVRERLFAELARILNQPIAYVNNIWQYGVEDGQPNIVKEDKETGTIRQSLNTGVLPIVNVDLYSLYSRGWFDNLVLDDDSNAKFDEIIQDIAPRFIKETLQDILPSVEIYATGVYHPREYNYGGDELEFDLVVNANEYNALKEKALSSDMFETYLKDNYSSRSGFISSMPDDIDEFNNADEWKQMVQVIMFALKDTALTDVNEAYLNDFSEAVNQEFPYVDGEIDNAIEELEYKASKENITLDVDYVTNYIKEQFGNTDSYDYILDKVLSGLNLTESARVDEAKKEELFNADVNVNIDAGDIASGNNLDLGGLGEIASAVGLMASEENTKSDKEKLAEDSDDEIPVVNPDEQDYYDNKGYIISLYPRSRSNVSII